MARKTKTCVEASLERVDSSLFKSQSPGYNGATLGVGVKILPRKILRKKIYNSSEKFLVKNK